MRRPAVPAATLLLVVPLVLGLGGCGEIPKAASRKSFCTAGEKFSASTSFKQGVAAAKELQSTGTPSDIPASARRGFVELVHRVQDAKDGQDFLKRNKKLTTAQGQDLMALTAYIKRTCSP